MCDERMGNKDIFIRVNRTKHFHHHQQKYPFNIFMCIIHYNGKGFCVVVLCTILYITL